jgi:isoleucyl-tRNA synthetase
MGYWVDMDHPYVTCDDKYIESLWALLKILYEKISFTKGSQYSHIRLLQAQD